MALHLCGRYLSASKRHRFKNALVLERGFLIWPLLHAASNFLIAAGMLRFVAALIKLGHIPDFTANQTMSASEMAV